MGEGGRQPGVDVGLVRSALKSQYHAGLVMLRDAVERCPDSLWTSDRRVNAFWQVAYHALYFTHLYLQPHEAAFRAWGGHRSDVQHEDAIAGPADPDSDLPLVPPPYTKREVLAYCTELDAMVDDAVDALDLHSTDSGFWWYPVSKLEHQIINIRHLHHHMAQLADRLRAGTGTGVAWVSASQPLSS